MAYAGTATSGLNAGEYVSAFEPNHVTGPHAGTKTCPPCTFGQLPQVQMWVNGDDAENVASLAKILNDTMAAKKASDLHTFVIFVTDAKNKDSMQAKIKKLSEKVGKTVAMAWVDKNDQSVDDYKINTGSDVKNTIFVYEKMKVVDKFVNLKADAKGKASLTKAIDGITK
jgi:hypothetical protein